MNNLAQLLVLAGQGPKPRPIPTGTIIDGFVVDVTTGVVHGQYLAIDDQDYTKQPLFIYNRSVRFEDLVWRNRVPGPHIKDVLTLFTSLETVWEAHKSSFNRKYFLTQRLLLQEICRIVGCTCDIKGRPIRDKRRYKKQIVIFHELLRIFVENKKVECQSPSSLAHKVSSIISNRLPKDHSPAEQSPGIRPNITCKSPTSAHPCGSR